MNSLSYWLSAIAMLAVLSCHAGEIVRLPHHPYRQIGTNLVDFSPIIGRSTPETDRRYCVNGIIVRKENNCYVVDRILSAYYVYQGDFTHVGRGSLLTSVAASRMSTIGLGQYLTLSPVMRSHYRKTLETETVLLTNYPYHPDIGFQITECALPLRSENKAYARIFDYGTHWTNALSTTAVYYQVRTNGIFPVKPKPGRVTAQGNGLGNATNSTQTAPPQSIR